MLLGLMGSRQEKAVSLTPLDSRQGGPNQTCNRKGNSESGLFQARKLPHGQLGPLEVISPSPGERREELFAPSARVSSPCVHRV